MEITNPIFIVGAARSGTKMLGKTFSLHPEVSYIAESNYIWRIGNASYPNDVLPLEILDEKIKREIREKFASKIEEGKNIFVEKTAASSLRLPYILEIFPDARFIHIARDGRDVALSAKKKWQGNLSEFEKGTLNYSSQNKNILNRIKTRLLSGDINLKELHNYFFKALNMIKTHLGISKSSVWGPVIPGIKELYNKQTLIEVCAYQWFFSVYSVLSFHENNFAVPYHFVRYEDLTKNKELELEKIFSFCNLKKPNNWQEIINSIKGGNSNKWKEQLTTEEINKVQNITALLLDKLDYKLYE